MLGNVDVPYRTVDAEVSKLRSMQDVATQQNPMSMRT